MNEYQKAIRLVNSLFSAITEATNVNCKIVVVCM